MRILVIGAGAVGGYFGGRLAQVGRDVSFLVRPPHAEAIRKRGLRIVSPHGDATLFPTLVLSEQITGAYDLIMLCVKAYSLDQAIKDFAPAVGPQTMILPMLNGMRHLEVLSSHFGEDAVLGGVCRIAAEVDSDGRIVQLTRIQQLIYGERPGGKTARLHSVDEAMQGANFEGILSGEIIQGMWEKWVMLASLGAATCLLRGNVGEITATPGGANLALAIMHEASAIAAASGHEPGEESRVWTEKLLTSAGSPLTSSMYRDMTSNARVEVDQILGDLVERGSSKGIATPLLDAACVQLRIYQVRLQHKETK